MKTGGVTTGLLAFRRGEYSGGGSVHAKATFRMYNRLQRDQCERNGDDCLLRDDRPDFLPDFFLLL